MGKAIHRETWNNNYKDKGESNTETERQTQKNNTEKTGKQQAEWCTQKTMERMEGK